jgi:hypothetical protein
MHLFNAALLTRGCLLRDWLDIIGFFDYLVVILHREMTT